MVSGESPAVARRRVRLALRAAREARGFTQGHVADQLDWSLSKVNRIEKGDVTVSRTDLLAMLELYGVNDQDRIDDLVQSARTSRQRGWWDEPRYREHLTASMLQLFQFEGQATAIRVHQPSLVPGLLQTATYAESVMTLLGDRLPHEVRRARIETRLRRLSHVLEREDPPDYIVLLDESVIARSLGGSTVMAEQLNSLLSLMEKSNVFLRIVPIADGAVMSFLGPFTIMDLGEEENAILYRENELADEIIHKSDIVRSHRQYFEDLWERALNEDVSGRLIQARVAALLSAMDRHSSD